MKQSLSLKIGQSLSMTPALQQAIRMLQLSTLDLQTEIQDALDSNFMLEREEADEPSTENTSASKREDKSATENIPENLPVDADWDDIYPSAPAPTGSRNLDDEALRDYQQANMHTTPDLQEHLTWQASMHPFTTGESEASVNIIDAIDEHGYLRDWPELESRLCTELDLSAETLAQVLTSIQAFDPPGIAARNLAECLRIQLHQLDPETPGLQVALALADERQLKALADGRLNAIKQQLEIAEDATLHAGVALIHQLQPHPGDAYSDHESQYVVPEVFVSKQQGRWRVSLNPEIAPKLRINSDYMALVKRSDKSQDQATIKEHLAEARFFLNSLKSRNETLLRVAQSIVEAQRAFLDYGPEAMKPLVLRDVADELEIHESTVSRATANKYMQTSRGLFELKYFFSSHVQTTDGGTCSATAIQAMIKRMVDTEASAKPLSDSKLASILLDEGIKVARRTVAKYREGLNIAPSHERRREAS